MATKKAAVKKATKTAKPRATAKRVVETLESKDEANRVGEIMKRIQDNFAEVGAALQESGSVMDEKRREIVLTLIENAQVNADATFAALRDVMEADSVTESIRIQRDALRAGIERNVAQVRDLASLTAQSGREAVQPVAGYISSLRSRTKTAANA
ncbi:MAG: phasin family protein [Parvularculaceae bacterium]|nr:phasin family protein [Parvularculaceae bacterium]